MRIVAGSAKGRRLLVPATGTRPTSERARAALFNRLDTLLDIDGARVLDLYAGSGAVGLEALSRGAAHVRFVESDRTAIALIRRNLEAVLGGDQARAAIDGRPVATTLVLAPVGGPFDVVFADPPYALPGREVDAVLHRATSAEWLLAGGVAVIERPARGEDPSWPVWVEPLRSKRYGEGVLWYGRSRGETTTPAPSSGRE